MVGALQDLHTSQPNAAEASMQSSSSLKADLDLSDSCVKRLQEIAVEGSFLRLTVEGGGCSGFQYKFELDTKTSDNDR